MRRAVGLGLIAIVVALPGCGAASPKEPGRVAEQFYAAVAAQDGARACSLLLPDTAEALAKEEKAPCAKAVVELELSGHRSAHSATYVTGTKVDLLRGDSVFLDETSEGWRIAAAGCKPQPGEEAPYDCEVES